MRRCVTGIANLRSHLPISRDRVYPRRITQFDVNHDVTRSSARSFLVQAFKLNDPLPAYLNLLCDSDGLIIIPNAVMQISRHGLKTLGNCVFTVT